MHFIKRVDSRRHLFIALWVLIALEVVGLREPLFADVLRRVHGEDDSVVQQLEEVDGMLWIVMDEEVYSYDGRNFESIGVEEPASSIQQVGDRLWVGTEQGLYIYDLDKRLIAEPAEPFNENITALEVYDHDKVFIASNDELLSLDISDRSTIRKWKESGVRLEVRSIKVFGDIIWLLGENGDCRMVAARDPGGSDELQLDADGGNGRLKWCVNAKVRKEENNESPSTASASSNYPIYDVEQYPTYDDTEQYRIAEQYHIYDVEQVGEEIWLATSEGIRKIKIEQIGNKKDAMPTRVRLRPRVLDGSEFRSVAVFNNVVWLGGRKRAYFRSLDEKSDGFVPIPRCAEDLRVTEIRDIAGDTWAATNKGLFRLEKDVDIFFKPNIFEILGQNLLLGQLRTQGSGYVGPERPEKVPIYVHFSVNRFELAQRDRSWRIRAEQLEHKVPSGMRDIFIIAVDPYGNSAWIEYRNVIVLPKVVLGPLVVSVVWLVIFLLAPFNQFSNDLVMLKPARRLFYGFGILAPALLMMIGFMRKHFLRRYMRNLCRHMHGMVDPGRNRFCDDALKTPSSKELILDAARKKGGARAFWWWRSAYASAKSRCLGRDLACAQNVKWAPVYLEIRENLQDGEEVKKWVLWKLNGLGRILDESLAMDFLNYGGFLFILDCTSSCLEGSRLEEVKKFIDNYEHRNYIVICASHPPDSSSGHLFETVGPPMTPATGTTDWPQWRGPGGLGISAAYNLPEVWSTKSPNVRRVALPGHGTSSPIVSRGQIFLTAAVPEPEGQVRLVVLSLDLASGEILRKTFISSAPAEKTSRLDTVAVPTPATDGEGVFVHFASVLACVDFDGCILWQTEVDASYASGYGASSSPVLTQDKVIIMKDKEWTATEDIGWVSAYDKKTGEEIWHRKLEDKCSSYSTPLVAEEGDEERLFLAHVGFIVEYDPGSGEPLWSYEFEALHLVPSLVKEGNIVCAVGGEIRERTVGCFRLEGRGRKMRSELLRQIPPRAPSPVLYNGRLFTLTTEGILNCYDAATGKQHWERCLEEGNHYASLVAGDGKIYALSGTGVTSVVAAEEQYRLISRNELGEGSNASPALVDGCLLIRTNSDLVCIEKAEPDGCRSRWRRSSGGRADPGLRG